MSKKKPITLEAAQAAQKSLWEEFNKVSPPLPLSRMELSRGEDSTLGIDVFLERPLTENEKKKMPDTHQGVPVRYKDGGPFLTP